VLLTAAAAFIVVGVGFDVEWGRIAAVGVGVFGAVELLDALGYVKDGWLGPRKPIEDRVPKLIAALSEATNVIGEIERDVKSRSELVARLQEDAERTRQLLALNREEVEAVAQTLRVEVEREGRRGLLMNVLLNAVFFGLGVGVTLLVGR
jgi:hypothetical protein